MRCIFRKSSFEIKCSFVIIVQIIVEKRMNLEIKKFGEVLMSRPAGKEAFSLAKAYIFPNLQPNEKIELDFADVKVLTPSLGR